MHLHCKTWCMIIISCDERGIRIDRFIHSSSLFSIISHYPTIFPRELRIEQKMQSFWWNSFSSFSVNSEWTSTHEPTIFHFLSYPFRNMNLPFQIAWLQWMMQSAPGNEECWSESVLEKKGKKNYNLSFVVFLSFFSWT